MKSRLLKAQCGTCAYTVRVARSWLMRALPECPLCREPMEAPEFEALCEAELEEWRIEQPDSAAPRTLQDRWVTTRAPHDCAGCRRSFEHPDKMRHRVYVLDGEMLREYWCLACDGAGTRGRPERFALARA